MSDDARQDEVHRAVRVHGRRPALQNARDEVIHHGGDAVTAVAAFQQLAALRPLKENAWSCTSFAHRLGEADEQHFYFASALSLDESGSPFL